MTQMSHVMIMSSVNIGRATIYTIHHHSPCIHYRCTVCTVHIILSLYFLHHPYIHYYFNSQKLYFLVLYTVLYYYKHGCQTMVYSFVHSFFYFRWLL